jgi:AraC family transcriptional regulator
MVQEIADDCPNGVLFAQSATLSLVTRLHERLSSRKPVGKERGRLTPVQMRVLDDFIDHHLDVEIPLATLAAQVGLSVPHFARLFRNTAGCSPHRHVVRKRVQRACELLQHTTMSLTSISGASGFSTQSHMNAVLKASLGTTPGKIRRAARWPSGR